MKSVKIYVTEGDLESLESIAEILNLYDSKYNEGWSINNDILNLESIIKDFKEALK